MRYDCAEAGEHANIQSIFLIGRGGGYKITRKPGQTDGELDEARGVIGPRICVGVGGGIPERAQDRPDRGVGGIANILSRTRTHDQALALAGSANGLVLPRILVRGENGGVFIQCRC